MAKNCNCGRVLETNGEKRLVRCNPCSRKYNKNFREKNPCRRVLWMIRQRCNDSNSIGFKYYGGKGIKCLLTLTQIVKLWKRDRAFAMRRPSIDRKRSGGDYKFSNCRFIELSVNSSQPRLDKTHCPRRHPYSGGNLVLVGKNKHRVCRICKNEANREWRRRSRR